MTHSELGIVKWFFTLCRLFWLAETGSEADAERVCKTLSRRLSAALVELRHPPVHRIFNKKHGSITGAQYRYDLRSVFVCVCVCVCMGVCLCGCVFCGCVFCVCVCVLA